jgi:hypothetical protein
MTVPLRKRRAERRSHRQRVIARALRVAKLFGIHDAADWARHNADNLKMCSCWMCGHVRKWCGPPVREMRRTLNLDE